MFRHASDRDRNHLLSGTWYDPGEGWDPIALDLVGNNFARDILQEGPGGAHRRTAKDSSSPDPVTPNKTAPECSLNPQEGSNMTTRSQTRHNGENSR